MSTTTVALTGHTGTEVTTTTTNNNNAAQPAVWVLGRFNGLAVNGKVLSEDSPLTSLR